VDRSRLIWEQEIYSELEYKANYDLAMHTFEADQSVAALLFLEDEEASRFDQAVRQRYIIRTVLAGICLQVFV